MRRQPPEELTVLVELDPPVDRVDAAAFAARGLAERLHATLAGHGLACTRLGVAARTVAGDELHRVWRCAEPLTPAGTVDRVRWQLDAWLARGGSGPVDRMWLVPEETVPAGALQLGLWGDVGEADERAGRALVRVQALLGPEAVVTAVLGGGRDPAERVRLVPWGDDRGEPEPPSPVPLPPWTAGVADPTMATAGETGAGQAGRGRSDAAGAAESPEAVPGPDLGDAAPAGWPEDVRRRTGLPSAVELLNRPPAGHPNQPTERSRRRRPPAHRSPRPSTVPEPPPSWPGRLPAPSPAVVPPEPLPTDVLDAVGAPVRLAAPDLLVADPAYVSVDGAHPMGVTAWAGPWPVWQRWWAPDGAPTARLQAVLDNGTAVLLVAEQDRWWLAGIYD